MLLGWERREPRIKYFCCFPQRRAKAYSSPTALVPPLRVGGALRTGQQQLEVQRKEAQAQGPQPLPGPRGLLGLLSLLDSVPSVGVMLITQKLLEGIRIKMFS